MWRTSTVGLPRLSKIWRAFTDWMVAAMAGAGAGAGLALCGLGRKPRSNQIRADGAESGSRGLHGRVSGREAGGGGDPAHGGERVEGDGGVGRNRWGRRRTEDGAARVWTRAALIREGDERDEG